MKLSRVTLVRSNLFQTYLSKVEAICMMGCVNFKMNENVLGYTLCIFQCCVLPLFANSQAATEQAGRERHLGSADRHHLQTSTARSPDLR